MSLLEKLPALAELQKQQASAEYKTSEAEFQYECEMLNVAPAMLAVLAQFQPGDKENLGYAWSEIMEIHNDPSWDSVKDCLRRLQEACKLMEANE